jgi:hypothetical protein
VPALAESVSQHPWAWLAILAMGVYHGLNPGMGWLFAVSNGLQLRRGQAVFAALLPIAFGHLVAMAVALLPFVVVAAYVGRLVIIRAVAGVVLLAFGLYKLVFQRHPRFLVRIGPSHLALWSFLMATAHGAGLMLVPVALSLCESGPAPHSAHDALAEIAARSVGLTVLAASAHTIAMVATGGAIAWIVYRYLGLELLRRAWFNLDLLWAALLIVVGIVSLVTVGWGALAT